MLYGAFKLLAAMMPIGAICSPAFSHASRLGDVVIVFVSCEDLRKQTFDTLRSGHRLRRARFRCLGFRIHLWFTGGNSTSSHQYRLFLEVHFCNLLACLAENLAPIV